MVELRIDIKERNSAVMEVTSKLLCSTGVSDNEWEYARELEKRMVEIGIPAISKMVSAVKAPSHPEKVSGRL